MGASATIIPNDDELHDAVKREIRTIVISLKSAPEVVGGGHKMSIGNSIKLIMRRNTTSKLAKKMSLWGVSGLAHNYLLL